MYADFATRLFEERQKHIKRETIYRIYDRFDGITWYLQRMLNKIFSLTEKADDKMMEKADDKTRELADDKMMELALNSIIDESAFAYEALLSSCQPSKGTSLSHLQRWQGSKHHVIGIHQEAQSSFRQFCTRWYQGIIGERFCYGDGWNLRTIR